MLSQPIFNTPENPVEKFTDTYIQILNQTPEQAVRRCRYGWSKITVETHLGLCQYFGDKVKSAITRRLPFMKYLLTK